MFKLVVIDCSTRGVTRVTITLVELSDALCTDTPSPMASTSKRQPVALHPKTDHNSAHDQDGYATTLAFSRDGR